MKAPGSRASLLLTAFATLFLRTLALRSLGACAAIRLPACGFILRSLGTCAAIRLPARGLVLRSLGACAAIRFATHTLGARRVLRCFTSLAGPFLRHTFLRSLRLALIGLSTLIHPLRPLFALRRARSFGLRPGFTRLRRIFLRPCALRGLRLPRLRTLRFLARAL